MCMDAAMKIVAKLGNVDDDVYWTCKGLIIIIRLGLGTFVAIIGLKITALPNRQFAWGSRFRDIPT